MALDAVIFDVDGTLVDSNRAHVEAWVRAFARHGYKVFADRVEEEIGKGGDKLVPDVLGEEAERRDGEALRTAQKEEFLRIARARKLAAFPGVHELVAELRRRGLRVAVATSSGAEHLKGLAESSGLDIAHLGDELVTADDIEETKPAPDLVQAAVRKLGLSPAQCAMVGDTPYDAEAAKFAGVVCLGLLSGGNDLAKLKRAGAREVWRDVADLHANLDAALERASPGPTHHDAALLERLMREALAAAREGLAAGEVPIGAVLAAGDGRVLARSHNEMRKTGSRTAHAEIVAFGRAPRTPHQARDLILVSTVEPCVMCTGAAMEAAVDLVVYAHPAPADAGTGRVLPPESPDNQMPRIVGGVLREESRALLEEWLRANGNADQRPYVEQVLATG